MSNLWIFNHYANSPESQATRSYDLGKYLVGLGHNVTIFASSYNHYSLQEDKLTSGEKWRVEETDGVRMVWLKTIPYDSNSFRRLLNIGSYAWMAFRVGIRWREKPDVIIGVTVHPLAGLVAYAVSKLKRSRFFFEVTDLWPEVLIEMGVLSRRHPVTWVLSRLEKFLYRRAEKIIMLWPDAHKYLAELGLPAEKMVWIPHCVDLSRYDTLEGYDGGTSSTFTVMCLGGHTLEYGLYSILDTARLLQERDSNVRFMFVGGGTEKPNLIARAGELELNNVSFRDPVPKSQINRVMSESDAFIFSRQNLSVFLKYGISNNKLCDYLASRRPTIFCCNASNNPVSEAGAGVSAPPEDPEALAQTIEELVAMEPSQREEMGSRGYEYVKQHHEVGMLARRLEQLL